MLAVMTAPPRAQRAFTLVEILIVIVIIGTMASLAVLSIGGGDRSLQLEQEARRVHAVMRMAAEKAIFEGEEIGFVLSRDQYHFVRFEPATGAWQELATREYRGHPLPVGFDFELEVDGDAPQLGATSAAQPSVLFLSSGEVTPFLLAVQDRDQPRVVFLVGSDGFSDVELDMREAGGL